MGLVVVLPKTNPQELTESDFKNPFIASEILSSCASGLTSLFFEGPAGIDQTGSQEGSPDKEEQPLDGV